MLGAIYECSVKSNGTGPASRALRGLERCRLEVTGSHLPARLAEEARSCLTRNIRTVYGATESTTVATADVAVTLADASAARPSAPPGM